MNSVLMVGRLVKEPELNFIPGSGTPVTKFTIAVDRINPKEGGPKADFFRVVVFGKIAEAVANNVKKGHMVAVKGELQNRSFDGKDGNKVTITEIIGSEVKFLEKKVSSDQEDVNYPDCLQ